MKKTVLFLTIILSIYLQTSAQTPKYGIDDNISISHAKGLIEYYAYVDTAEMYIVDDNKELAAQYYLKAFTFKKHPFSYDFSNAFRIAIETKDTILLKQLIIINIADVTIDKESYISNLTTSLPQIPPSFFQQLKPILDTIQTKTKSNKIIHILDSLVKEDQYERTPPKTVNEETQKRDSLRLNSLLELYDKYQYISEENCPSHSSRGMYYADLIQLILVHNPNQIDIWYPIMLQQVYLGYFPNKYFVSILENYYFKANNDFFCFSFWYSYTLPNYHIIIKLDSLEENHLNNTRKRFFLEPHLDEQKKRIWNFKEKTNYSFYNILSSGKYIPKDNKKAGIQQIGEEDYIRSFIDKYGENKLIIHEK
jgi:hypothetical protein